MNKQNKNELIDVKNRLVITRSEGVWGLGEVCEQSQLYGEGR